MEKPDWIEVGHARSAMDYNTFIVYATTHRFVIRRGKKERNPYISETIDTRFVLNHAPEAIAGRIKAKEDELVCKMDRFVHDAKKGWDVPYGWKFVDTTLEASSSPAESSTQPTAETHSSDSPKPVPVRRRARPPVKCRARQTKPSRQKR